jgi:hypothetical protein
MQDEWNAEPIFRFSGDCSRSFLFTPGPQYLLLLALKADPRRKLEFASKRVATSCVPTLGGVLSGFL